ncbi:rhodanese-related sulfurtransferase [Candidatus Fonsibacter ubiquis]|uniref:oxygen-dependent tRNA uridine(34) hydroxylase TrhO n=1 Tax=Candidatus Fonsibacter ubiquis TaxID=1925548 RepID=UPI000C0847F9|nr:rhodanese-related sulfurtransferase [Candidatus Fonsibacter ubiquis]
MLKLISFYKFVKILNPIDNKLIFKKFLIDNKLKGSIIFSFEGINGSIAGKQSNIEILSNFLKKKFLFDEFDNINECDVDFIPFKKAKIKIKKEVVPLNELFNDNKYKFQNRVEPEDWNKLILSNDVTVVDVRKSFESEIGTFEKAINPKINDFRKFPEYFEKLSSDKDKKIAMFCTGGIRCEKAASYLFKRGFKNVYQLKGGILNYLNKIPSKKSLWNGECFVFDERITVVNNSKIGNYLMCAGCRTPISKKDIQSPKYEKDVSCPKCFDKLTEKQKYRFRMRASQKLNGKLKTNLLHRASV